MQTPAEVVEGTVEQRNPNGVRVRGNWYNKSKFRPLEVELPPVGALVRVSFDTKGFLTDVETLEHDASHVDDEETTLRLGVLQAAATFVGRLSQSHVEVRSEHVLLLADKWLAWVRDEPQEQN